jgi:hypothetical protein
MGGLHNANANRTPRIAKPALRDKQTDKQVEMGDSGLLEL